ncbi:MAG: histidine kinase [Cellulophaga sp.]
MKTIRILAVDDHEMIMMGYKYILEDINFNDFTIHVETANTFELGKRKIEDSVTSFKYDVLFLDVQLTPPRDTLPQTGEELGILARKIIPDTKIVFLSSFSDNYRINSILKSVNPEGYMVKTEIDSHTLEAMMNTIMTSPPYYTNKALIAIRASMASNVVIDENDKKILYYLSIGTKTKDIVAHVSLSLPGIENRKRQLRSIFNVEKQNDQALIREAKNRGFI